MPTFNIFRGFGGSKTQPSQRTPIVAKDYAYSAASRPLPVPSGSAYSRSASVPPEIIRSQPIIDPSLGRRGTLKKKKKHHHYMSEDISPMSSAEPQYASQDDIIPGPPPVMHDQISGYQANTSPFHAGSHSYAYEDYHPHMTGTSRGPVTGDAYGGELPLHQEPLSPHVRAHPEIHDGRHHTQSHHSHRHHRHHHSHSPPQHDSYAAPPVHAQYSHGHRSSHSRSRSFTPIPSVYREPDSGDLDMYADPADDNDYMSGGTMNRHSTDRYEHEDFEGHGHGHEHRHGHGHEHRHGHEHEHRHGHGHEHRHGRQAQTQARIGWLPDNMQHRAGEEHRGVSEPENTFVDDSEPQIIPAPFASDNPFQSNIYHAREPDHIPDHRHRHQPTSGEYVYGNQHRGHEKPAEPRKKTYMYTDYHRSETIEPRTYEGHPSQYSGDPDNSDPEEYRYIVPKGVSVIFRDHDGNPIARIGHPGSTSGGRQKDMVPFTVQDEYGNILYRHEGDRYRDDRYLRSGVPSRPRTAKVIMIDKHGNQIPLKTDESHSDRSHHSHPSHRSHRSHSSHHSQSSSSQHPHSTGRRRAYH